MIKLLARPLVALVLCASLGAALAGSKPPQVVPVVFAERVLPNGLQVISVRSQTSPTVSVHVWYHVGSKDDPNGRSGFAHLFEHLMFKSTRYLKSEQFDRLTEDVGGSNNAFTSNDVTAYHEVVPSNHLETLLWAEAERLSNLNVDEANFKSERAVVEEEYRQRVLATPYGRFYNALEPAAYLSHPYKRPGIGSIEDLEAATLADVEAFHRSHYRTDNATLVIAGDFEPKQLDAWVDKYFGPLARPAAPLQRLSATEPAWPSDRSVSVTGPAVPLPAVALLWLAPPVTHPDNAALQIASALLSGGESSRLNQSLVYHQQLASQASFESDLRAGPGMLAATAVAAGGKKLADVKAALLREVLALAQLPVGAAELAKVKTQLLTRTLLARQTPDGLAHALADAAVQEGNAAQVNAGLQALLKVTSADVQRVMRQYVTGAHKVSVEYTQEGASK
jgi:zinc protease